MPHRRRRRRLPSTISPIFDAERISRRAPVYVPYNSAARTLPELVAARMPIFTPLALQEGGADYHSTGDEISRTGESALYGATHDFISNRLAERQRHAAD